MKDAVIVDSGGANLASIIYALERLGVRATVSADGATIASADRVIVPGVGAAGIAMRRLKNQGLSAVLRTLTQPVLGICLGMQILFRESEEGPTPCLGVFPDLVRRLRTSSDNPIPHMGWNQVETHREDPLLEGIDCNEYMYFVHSYAVEASDFTLACTQYGTRWAAVVRRRNFWGTQFHPERSGKAGARLLSNFLGI